MTPTDSRNIHNVILGTAGHIDHGKTALLHRLSGIDADRLPEEKERGMTIDLGFAPYQIQDGPQVGFIDVPGHERFIKNMVAGATGIDLVLLVIAADDGVMPQTREHLEIMRFLGLEHGLIVLTKIDLVEEELRELAMEDAKEAVQGTFLESAPILPVSSITGEGFDELTEVLHKAIFNVKPKSTEGLFRLPIQRIFSSKGFGTVLTGVPLTGQVSIGETLEVLPLGKQGRVRGVQAYSGTAEKAQAGQSSAINISDIDYKEVSRGMVLATPGFFESTDILEVRFEYLKSASKPLRHLSAIRFHCGTSEVLGKICLLENKQLEPGDSTWAQLRLEDPVVVAPGDKYVLRLHSPMVTIGGGEILDRSRWRLKQGRQFVLENLQAKQEALGSPSRRILGGLQELGFESFLRKEIPQIVGLPPDTTEEVIEILLQEGSLREASRPGYLTVSHNFSEGLQKLRTQAQAYFNDHPKRLLMPKTQVRASLKGQDLFFNDLLEELIQKEEAEIIRGEFVKWNFHKPKLSEKELDFRGKLFDAMKNSPFTPPKLEEVAEEESFDISRAEGICQLLLEEGDLIRVAEGIYFHREALDEGRERIRKLLEEKGEMTASEAKTLLESSRRYMIPLLEFYDQEGFTIRRGDVRELRKTK